MIRKRFKFKPEWEGPIEGWVVRYSHKVLWRVFPRYDVDDLYQDAYLYFVMCCERYPAAKNARHFMSLFQRCFSNHVHQLSNMRTRDKAAAFSQFSFDDHDAIMVELFTQAYEDDVEAVDYGMMLEDAPQIVKKIVSKIASGNHNGTHTSDGRRLTTNEFLCQLVGVDNSLDIVTLVRNWYGGSAA